MKLTIVNAINGPAGTGFELRMPKPPPKKDWEASLSTWILVCPGQSPAWDHYMLSLIHLRSIEGVRPAIIREPLATHEVIVLALEGKPVITKPRTWRTLSPANVMEQIELPSDDLAVVLCAEAAQAVVNGILPAEPMLSGQREPWRTSMVKTAAHLRGEDHAA